MGYRNKPAGHEDAYEDAYEDALREKILENPEGASQYEIKSVLDQLNVELISRELELERVQAARNVAESKEVLKRLKSTSGPTLEKRSEQKKIRKAISEEKTKISGFDVSIVRLAKRHTPEQLENRAWGLNQIILSLKKNIERLGGKIDAAVAQGEHSVRPDETQQNEPRQVVTKQGETVKQTSPEAPQPDDENRICGNSVDPVFHSEEGIRTWIFQVNTEVLDIEGYLAAPAGLITWRLDQYAAMISSGDSVYFWASKGDDDGSAGIVAEGTIAESPRMQNDDPLSAYYWRRAPEVVELVRVKIRINRIASKNEVLKREQIKDDSVLSKLFILRSELGMICPVEEVEAQRLRELWAETRKGVKPDNAADETNAAREKWLAEKPLDWLLNQYANRPRSRAATPGERSCDLR